MQSVRQLSYQDIRVFNHLLVLWDSNKYLVSPIGPVNVTICWHYLARQIFIADPKDKQNIEDLETVITIEAASLYAWYRI